MLHFESDAAHSYCDHGYDKRSLGLDLIQQSALGHETFTAAPSYHMGISLPPPSSLGIQLQTVPLTQSRGLVAHLTFTLLIYSVKTFCNVKIAVLHGKIELFKHADAHSTVKVRNGMSQSREVRI